MKTITGAITAPQGFKAGGVCARIKKTNDKDLAIIYSTQKCVAAGVFTTNTVQAACVELCQKHLTDGHAQAIIANSGNANCCTGEQGVKDTQAMANLTAAYLNIKPNDVLVASTGVIGVPLPMEQAAAGIKEAASNLDAKNYHDAALAIMTTDLVSKEIAVQIEMDGVPVTIGAMAKGSGMIHPDMATLLAFITTDALISHDCLQQALKTSVDLSYNMISVDRDTSTNDMALILANGLAGNGCIDQPQGKNYESFVAALTYINTALAKMIARDGEGATRLMEISVINAADQHSARAIARSVSASNLTKAAVFGEDPNWGRIICAAGYAAGVKFDPQRTDIYLGTVQVAQNGMGLAFDEALAKEQMRQETVLIKIDLKSGSAGATAWGCDLSYDYVKINASYRS